MTAEAMSSLPMQAGSAVVAAAGRTTLWAISLYMRQPLRNTAIAALIGVSALAGSNALYKQAHHHPAPLFGSFSATPAGKAVTPVVPAAKPKKLAQPTDAETTGSVAEPVRVISAPGNDDVTALQQKLAALGMFSGSVDGIFGPRTAKAIKAFETSIGKTPKGQLTTDIVAQVKAAPLPDDLPATGALPTTAAKPAIETMRPLATATLPTVTADGQATPAAAPVDTDPLPAPAPLLATTAASPRIVSVPQPAETQVASLDDDAGTDATPVASLPTAVTKRAVQTIAVRAKPFAARPDDVTAPADAGVQTMPEKLPPVMDANADPASDPAVVAAVQRGLNSLGFLHAPADGVAGETTAKAIRNFEVYFNYNVTGRVTRELVNLLEQNGAVI